MLLSLQETSWIFAMRSYVVHYWNRTPSSLPLSHSSFVFSTCWFRMFSRHITSCGHKDLCLDRVVIKAMNYLITVPGTICVLGYCFYSCLHYVFRLITYPGSTRAVCWIINSTINSLIVVDWVNSQISSTNSSPKWKKEYSCVSLLLMD